MKKQKLKKAAALAAVVSTVFAVTACGSKADDSSSKAEKSDTVYRTLQEIKEDGTINIGVFLIKILLGMWMKMEHIRGMMYILRTGSVRISG